MLQRGPVAVPQPGGPPPPGPSRGLAAPEVTAVAAIAAGLAEEGPLARESALHLYYLAAACQATGRLVLGSELATYRLAFKKGGAALVEVEGHLRDGGRLVWFLPPKVLRKLG